MILADTSVWIALINGHIPPPPEGVFGDLVTCGPVVQEVLQGFRDQNAKRSFEQAFDSIPRLADPMPESLFRAAADIYLQGRRQGITIRSSTDCLIGAIALEHGVPVWHRERDFDKIARLTGLRTIARLRPR